MKKFLLMIALAFGMIAVQSCDEKFGVEYSLSVGGDAVGNVQFTIPVGYVALNGDADVDLLVTNDTTKTFAVAPTDVLVLGDALTANEAEVAEAASAVDTWLTENFSVTTADGNYYVQITGYVKETLTGLTFSVDKVFTNRSDAELKAE